MFTMRNLEFALLYVLLFIIGLWLSTEVRLMQPFLNFSSNGFVQLVQPDKIAALHEAYHECVEVLTEVDCLRERDQ